jgi:hypothetical protein
MAVSSPSYAPEKKRMWLLSTKKVSVGSRPHLSPPLLSWVGLSVPWFLATARMPRACL